MDQAEEQLRQVDGVMIGREAYHNPWMLVEADQRIFGDAPAITSRHQVVERLIPFIQKELAAGTPSTGSHAIFLGLFQGQPGARAWRRHISENAHRKDAAASLLSQAAALVRQQESAIRRASESHY